MSKKEGGYTSKDGTRHYPPGTKSWPTKEGGLKVKPPNK
jgi:hypothetical protein